MVPLTSLWAPILVSAVAVFLASFILHMVLPYHRSDYSRVASEDEVMDGLRKASIAPGDYFLPHAGSPAAMKHPEYKAKLQKGPLVVMTVLKPGAYTMGPRLAQWFVYTLVVSGLAGLLASHASGAMASPRRVFHFAAIVAFASYAIGLWQDSIWYSRKWSTTIKSTFDSLIYAALTGAVFVWLWPR